MCMYIDVNVFMCARTQTHTSEHTKTQTNIKKPDTNKQMRALKHRQQCSH